MQIFLSSIYQPAEHDGQQRFIEEMAWFYNAIARNAKLLCCQYVNLNVGIQSKMFQYVLGN